MAATGAADTQLMLGVGLIGEDAGAHPSSGAARVGGRGSGGVGPGLGAAGPGLLGAGAWRAALVRPPAAARGACRSRGSPGHPDARTELLQHA